MWFIRDQTSKKKGSSAMIKCKFLPCLFWVACLLANSAHAQNRHYLPQIANGFNGCGGFKTTFVLCNTGGAETTANLNMSDDSGNPLAMTIGGISASQFAIQLPAGATRFLETDGIGNLVSGAAAINADANIGVSAIFSGCDDNGNFLAETGIGDSQPQSSFIFPVDTTDSFNAGLALFNIAGDVEFEINGLQPNSHCYYRFNVKERFRTAFCTDAENSFFTQRASGNSFVFGVQGDSHPERQDKMLERC
jgi:hypothetical protein